MFCGPFLVKIHRFQGKGSTIPDGNGKTKNRTCDGTYRYEPDGNGEKHKGKGAGGYVLY